MRPALKILPIFSEMNARETRSSSVMNSDFATIAEFLDRNGPEVLGRALPNPPPALGEQLDRFIRGELSPEERASICEVLRSQPEYLRLLAFRVKDRRQRSEDATSE